MSDLAHRGALSIRTLDAVALAHALLSYPTWRTALTGPATVSPGQPTGSYTATFTNEGPNTATT